MQGQTQYNILTNENCQKKLIIFYNQKFGKMYNLGPGECNKRDVWGVHAVVFFFFVLILFQIKYE